MNRDALIALARRGDLYPSVIVYGGRPEDRATCVYEVARTLLCEAPLAERPCGECRHCRRLTPELFHPDLHWLRRDLRLSTSVTATRELTAAAQMAPFESRAQVFVIEEAETLGKEAANALLKTLEEPPGNSPRHFFLCCPSRLDLLPTLRSRSWSVYLGLPTLPQAAEGSELGDEAGALLSAWLESGSALYLQALADRITELDHSDARDEGPWIQAALACREALDRHPALEPLRRPLLELALAFLGAVEMRRRSVPPSRLAEGLIFRHLVGSPASVVVRRTIG